MLDIRPGLTPDLVAGYLRDCRLELGEVQQAYSAFDALAAYQRWANHWARTLGTAISPGDVTRLITSQRYWVLQSLASGHAALRELIELEVAERTVVLDREVADLAATVEQWAIKPVAAIVLDTSVLLEHHDDLASLDWNALSGEQGRVNLVLTVPLAAIRELDNHKRSRTQAPDGKVALRTQARQALRTIASWIPAGTERTRVRTATSGASDVYVAVLLDPLDHRPIADADSEIIDRAASLAPFVDRTYLATYDRAMALGARRVGLTPIELEYDD